MGAIRGRDCVLIIQRLNDASSVFPRWLPELEHVTFTVNNPKSHTLFTQKGLKVLVFSDRRGFPTFTSTFTMIDGNSCSVYEFHC